MHRPICYGSTATIIFGFFQSGIIFRRPNLTSVDVRLWPLMTFPVLKGLRSKALMWTTVFFLWCYSHLRNPFQEARDNVKWLRFAMEYLKQISNQIETPIKFMSHFFWSMLSWSNNWNRRGCLFFIKKSLFKAENCDSNSSPKWMKIDQWPFSLTWVNPVTLVQRLKKRCRYLRHSPGNEPESFSLFIYVSVYHCICKCDYMNEMKWRGF